MVLQCVSAEKSIQIFGGLTKFFYEPLVGDNWYKTQTG